MENLENPSESERAQTIQSCLDHSPPTSTSYEVGPAPFGDKKTPS